MLKLPKGISDFKSIIEEGYEFVDKTLFIQEFIDDPARVVLIPRPRRFGKTTNMSMLKYFFEIDKAGENSKLFKDTAISRLGDTYMKHQGAYPSVFISLKRAGRTSFEDTCNTIEDLIQECYMEHSYLINSTHLNTEEKAQVERLCKKSATKTELERSLVFLTHALRRHFNKPVMLFVDEYDAPMHASMSSEKSYLSDMVDFMRIFLGSVLKDNTALQKAAITGILQVGQASLFSGLNNIRVCNLFNSGYSTFFGFLQEEVDQLFAKSNLVYDKEEIKSWYNGYYIGQATTVYNPWSIVSCILEKGEVGTYWLETGEYGLIGKAFQHHRSAQVRSQLQALMEGRTIGKTISIRTVLQDMRLNESALWTVLFFAGYLRVHEHKMLSTGSEHSCVLSAPNREIQGVYARWAQYWFVQSMGDGAQYKNFLDALVFADLEAFKEGLQEYLSCSISYFDLGKKSEEKIYHVFLLGLLAGIRDHYKIESNQESGKGRFDLMLYPLDKEKQMGVVIELKATDKEANLASSAQVALDQIKRNNYIAKLKAEQVPSILAIGMSFYGKEVSLEWEKVV